MSLLFMSLHPMRARADDLPVVTFVPQQQTGQATLFDQQIPASKSFLVRYPVASDTEEATAVLDVWPKAEAPPGATPCASPPSPGARQRYQRGMVLTGDGSSKSLQAQVPPLQIGQPFCFQVRVTRSISTAELQGIALSVAQRLVNDVLSRKHGCYDDTDQASFRNALSQVLMDQHFQGADVSEPARLALNAYRANETSRQCLAAVEADHLRVTEQQLEGAARRMFELRGRLGALPIPSRALGSPLVKLSTNQLVTAESLLSPGTPDQTLQEASQQLRDRMGPSGEQWNTVLQAWSDALGRLATTDPPAKADVRTELKRGVGTLLPAPPSLELWNGKQFVPPDSFLKVYHSKESEPLALQTLGLLPRGAETAPWISLLTELVAAQANQNQLQQDFETRDEQARTQRAAFTALLVSAFKSDEVRKHLFLLLRDVQSVPPVVGEGTTPDHASYASADLGVLGAYPGYDFWVLPYIGLNVYATPVDRAIPFSQLTGTRLQKLGQRLSLTLGVTLSNPNTPGQSLEGPLLGRFPLLAVGCRITSYVRVVGGAVFYTLDDPNPASAGKTLRAAGFLGVSLDADIAHLLTQAL